MAEAHEREAHMREHRPPPRIEGRTVIVVDDGLATGATMRAALRSVRSGNPERLVMAAPVGSREACEEMRTEADEVTYSLHVMLRFEVEYGLIEGKVTVGELPELWRRLMREFLGIEPSDDANGVLQDIHWSMGAYGYFPTYFLGNLYGAQFDRAASVGKRIGYSLYLLAIIAFFVALIAGFNDTWTWIVVGALLAGSLFLLPAIILGYAVKAAHRADLGLPDGH